MSATYLTTRSAWTMLTPASSCSSMAPAIHLCIETLDNSVMTDTKLHLPIEPESPGPLQVDICVLRDNLGKHVICDWVYSATCTLTSRRRMR